MIQGPAWVCIIGAMVTCSTVTLEEIKSASYGSGHKSLKVQFDLGG